jgi:hypothetical protein
MRSMVGDMLSHIPLHCSDNIPAVGHPNNSAILESQQSDINLITLERNSFNFLEFV